MTPSVHLVDAAAGPNSDDRSVALSDSDLVVTHATENSTAPTHHVLIDYENVQPTTLSQLDKQAFKVLVFLGSQQKRLPRDMATQLQAFGDRAAYVEIAGSGPNALDFHIACYIGMLATRAPDSHFHIISRDKGFDPLITHLRERQLHVSRSPTLADIPPLLKVTTQQALAHLAAVEANLLTRSTSRPASVKTLRNTIKTLLPSTLQATTAAETIIKEMQRRRDIVIESNKVSYHLSWEPGP